MPDDIPEPVPWWRAEPGRWERDQREIAAHAPGLEWTQRHAGTVRGAAGWHGRLPVWPFDRSAPVGLDRLGPGLWLELIYPQAYPVVPAVIYPLDPSPDLLHRTDHRWHLNGDGSLCLLERTAQWDLRASVVDLLLKAAGWRVEYALMQAGLVDSMSESGIVSDDALDQLLGSLPVTGGASAERSG